MQGNPPWFTPTTSALNNQHADNSNYFYNYSQSWNRSTNRFPQEYYNGSGQYPLNSNMRNCSENQGFAAENNNYQCSQPYYRQDNIPTDGSLPPNVRSRHDRNQLCSQNGTIPNNGQLTSLNSKLRHSKYPSKSNENESENFSSVFTQSLTSLYSQDAEANFEEKNFKCEPEDGANVTELNNCARSKPDDLSNGCTTEYNFSSAFNNDVSDNPSRPSASNSFENIKVKSEFPTMEESLRYENYSIEDSYLKRRRSLADAYSRKRKRSSVPQMSYRAQNVDSKAHEIYRNHSQWIPNSLQSCQGNETSSSDTYQMPEFRNSNPMSNFDIYENSRGYKRHPGKPRGYRGRLSNSDSRLQNAIKRIPKKVSPLTVYAKILDDRILEVTCRRFKKRTKPITSEDNTSVQNIFEGGCFRSNDSFDNIYHSVEKLVRNIVNRVVLLSLPKRQINLSEIHTDKAKELLFRFCTEYSLYFGDFQDFDDILKINVPNDNTEEVVVRKRKRRATADKEDSNTSKSEKLIEKEEVVPQKSESRDKVQVKLAEKSVENENVNKIERKSGRSKKQHIIKEQHRVLRNLPSRQPANKSRKKGRKAERNAKCRYPKRKSARNGKGNRTKKLKIVIDLSKDNDQPEVLEMESDSSRQTSKSGADKEEDIEEEEDEDDEEERVQEDIEKIDNTEQFSTPLSKAPSLEKEEEEELKSDSDSIIVSKEDSNEKDDNSISDAKQNSIPDLQSSFSPVSKDVEEALKNIKKEVDEEEKTTLRQPPQLVCMTTESRHVDKIYLDSSQVKSINSSTCPSEGRLSPMYLQANGMEEAEAPSPPKLKRTGSSKYNQNFSGESNSSDYMAVDSDDPDDKLVIDMEAHEQPLQQEIKDTKEEKEAKEKHKTETIKELKVDNCEKESLKVMSPSKPIEDIQEDDDCVVVQPDIPIKRAPIEIIDLVMKEKSDIEKDKHSLLKEKLLEKPIFKQVKDQLIEIEKSALSSGIDKCSSKAEQDESILRTLLLESEVMAGAEAPDEVNTALSNVLNLTGQETSGNLDLLKNSDSKVAQLTSLSSDQSLGLNDALKLLKYQSYQDAYANNSSSSETFDDSQKRPKLENTSANSNQTDSKDNAAKEPEQLTEKIKKLKNEILYLQLMAEQKEKEKIAIVCFKKYKEEILKRICKAYAFSVQDHVRDWIFSRRENSGESKLASDSNDNPINAHKNVKIDNSRVAETSRSAVDNSKDNGLYPVPAPAHASSTHRPQSIHSPQTVTKGNRNSHAPGERVSAVETMVAKATENYGLDMRNLRDGLRTSPDDANVPATILQKALSSNSSRNSSPDPRNTWSPERAHKKTNEIAKVLPPVTSSPYTEPYSPLDMMVPQKSTSHKHSDLYRSGADLSRPPKSFHGNEKSQIQSLLSEPVQLKANRNQYRAWSIQAGGRISEDRTKSSKPVSSVTHQSPVPTSVTSIDSPLQRQLNSHKPIARPNFAMPTSLETSNYSHISNHHDHRERSSSSVSSERVNDKKHEEDRRHHPYGSSTLSSNSTMPYGGHIIQNSPSPVATVLSSNKHSISAVQGNSSSSSSTTASSDPGLNNTPLCMGCGMSDAKFLCSGCRKHWYCSPQCQTLRWPEHSRVCAGRMFSQPASSYS